MGRIMDGREYKYSYPSTDKYRMNMGRDRREDRSEDCLGILDNINKYM